MLMALCSHGRAPNPLPYHLHLSAAVLFLGRPPSLAVLSQRGSADRTVWTLERDLQQVNEGREAEDEEQRKQMDEHPLSVPCLLGLFVVPRICVL